ncbi:MAG TPA: phage tail tube protein [Candidatus Bathyarchaeia archaeon]|nr:phage tail tube protein [Candidatus Bathyarchaeia archaeon]
MSSPSGGWLVVKNLQYAEEASYGVFPTNPAMSWIAPIGNADVKADMQNILVPQLGVEDLVYILKGAETYSMEMEYAMASSTFAKYAISSQGGGTGTIDKSLSILFSAKMSGTENFVQLLGSRVGSLTISSRYGDLTKVKCTLTAKSIPVPSTSTPIGSGSYATDPAVTPWSFYDGGVNPVTIGAANPDVREIQVTFERNVEKLHVLGQSQQKFMPPKQRRINGTFTIIWEDTGQYTNLTNATSNTISWVLKSATSTLTLSGCYITRLESWKFDPTEVVYEKYAFTAKTVTIT